VGQTSERPSDSTNIRLYRWSRNLHGSTHALRHSTHTVLVTWCAHPLSCRPKTPGPSVSHQGDIRFCTGWSSWGQTFRLFPGFWTTSSSFLHA
jgi:hypothetical protein